MGADSLHDFFEWRSPDEICRLASLLVVGRPGSPTPDLDAFAAWLSPKQMEEFESHYVRMPLVEISSREIRARKHFGKSIRYLLPRGVEKYIEQQGLYVS
jgi:nicotinate-nucleotide adenylyltransferase